MKDKQIKIEKTIFYMLLILVMVYRGAILFKYSFYYVDDDQALMWYGTVSFAHFDFHEPCFFGQSYGSMIESLLAVPFYILHIPLNVALPVSTLIFTTLPFLYLGIKSLENNRMVAAYIILFVYAAMSYDWDVLTSIPRAFVGGFIFGVIGGVLINEEGKWYKYLIASYCIYLGCIITNTVVAIAGMSYLAMVLYNKIDKDFIKKRFPGLIAGNVLGFITGYFIKMFYVNNPDYNLHPAYNAAVSLEVLRENIADFNEIAGWFTPVTIGAVWIIVMLVIVWICIYRGAFKSLIMTVFAFFGFIAILSLDKMEDYMPGTLLYGQLRMLLFVPYMIALVVFLCSCYDESVWNRKKTYAGCIVMVLCFLAVMVIKSNIIIKEIISEDSVLYNSEVINLQQSDDLIENAREAGRIAVENNCDVVIQVDGNKAFGYICSALNYKKFIQYNAEYDRRTWVYHNMQQPGNFRCLLVKYNSDDGLSTEVVEIYDESVTQWLYDNMGLTRNN